MMKQSKDPFEVAFEEQEESPPDSPVNSSSDDRVRDIHTQSAASRQLTTSNDVQIDEDYDDDDNNDNDNDDGNNMNGRPLESTMGASSSMQIPVGTTVAPVSGKNNKEEEDEEELEEDNMDVELGKFSSTGDQDKLAKMQSILSQFTEEQMSRYESFRRSGFQKANMKRLLGSITGSPKISMPMTIVVSGIAKIYVGELVETSRVVMTERNENGPIRPCHIREAYRRLKLEGKVPRRSVPRLFRGKNLRTPSSAIVISEQTIAMNNSNPSANDQETESRNATAGATEKKVETVNKMSTAGGHQQEQRPVQVTHQPQPKKSNTSGGLLENAAASVTTALENAKEAISD